MRARLQGPTLCMVGEVVGLATVTRSLNFALCQESDSDKKYCGINTTIRAGMRSFVLSLAATLAFAGAAFAQTTPARSNLPEVLRGTSNKPAAETSRPRAPPSRPPRRRRLPARWCNGPAARSGPRRETLRGSRYGGFAPAPAAATAAARYHQPAQPQPGERQLRRSADRHLLVGRRLSPRRARQAQPLPARHAGQCPDRDGSAAVRRAVAHHADHGLRRLHRGAVGLPLAHEPMPGWPASAAAWRATAST